MQIDFQFYHVFHALGDMTDIPVAIILCST